jgi:prepilin-type N-terminal cleavage/methylation domain-containing protein
LECLVGMSESNAQSSRGFSLAEVTVVVAIMGALVAIAWPLTKNLLDRAGLVAATEMLRADIRKAQRESRTSGQTFELRIDPSAGAYVMGPIGGHNRQSRLPDGLSFGSPDSAESDGVTFRDNIARFSPRPGLQNSFGSITVRSRGGAQRITVSITGHVAVAKWNGREWR